MNSDTIWVIYNMKYWFFPLSASSCLFEANMDLKSNELTTSNLLVAITIPSPCRTCYLIVTLVFVSIIPMKWTYFWLYSKVKLIFALSNVPTCRELTNWASSNFSCYSSQSHEFVNYIDFSAGSTNNWPEKRTQSRDRE